MISWEEYIESNIAEFREQYKDSFSRSQITLLEKDREAFLYSLNKPSQIIVVDFEDRQCIFIIAHNQEHPDMEVLVFENAVFENWEDKVFVGKRLLGLLGIKKTEINQIVEQMKRKKHYRQWKYGPKEDEFQLIYTPLGKRWLLLLSSYDPRYSGTKFHFATTFLLFSHSKLHSILREQQRREIKKTVSELREDAEAIPKEIELRSKIIESTQRLDSQMKQLDEKVEKEISAVRKLIGLSESIQDWKLLISDVNRLKGEHVPREIFDTEVRRINEKINKGLEALNTRIEDLKAIKFWSKRTLLEIALAIMTVIAALYGAGVIKF